MAKRTNRYVALDVETANSDQSSICKIGIVVFEDGQEISNLSYLVNPECDFDVFNIKKHGITPDVVRDAPVFKDLHWELSVILHSEQAVCHHNHMEPYAFKKACEKYGLDQIDPVWFDTLKIAEKLWGRGGNSLPDIAQKYNWELNHHDPVSDARICGLLFKEQILSGKFTAEQLQKIGAVGAKRESHRTKNPYTKYYDKRKLAQDGNPEGVLHEVVAFSDTYTDKSELAGIASKNGCTVTDNVTRKTTMLVVGNKMHITSKVNKALEYNEKYDQGIKIVSEDEFMIIIEEECAG